MGTALHAGEGFADALGVTLGLVLGALGGAGEATRVIRDSERATAQPSARMCGKDNDRAHGFPLPCHGRQSTLAPMRSPWLVLVR